MTEDEAKERVAKSVSRETLAILEIYADILRQGAAQQNLVALSTLDHLWGRHILDSVQLLALAPDEGLWLDIGSGAGLPGLVAAAAFDREVMLVEPRKKRCAFLRDAADHMGIGPRVTVVQSRIETAPQQSATVISARAVASLSALFSIGQRFATRDTLWLLPKGRTAAEEVEAARASWHARLELVPSITDSEAAIVVATDIRPKGKRA